jgi:hypothetical protein
VRGHEYKKTAVKTPYSCECHLGQGPAYRREGTGRTAAEDVGIKLGMSGIEGLEVGREELATGCGTKGRHIQRGLLHSETMGVFVAFRQ